jgi:hypothetical protein
MKNRDDIRFDRGLESSVPGIYSFKKPKLRWHKWAKIFSMSALVTAMILGKDEIVDFVQESIWAGQNPALDDIRAEFSKTCSLSEKQDFQRILKERQEILSRQVEDGIIPPEHLNAYKWYCDRASQEPTYYDLEVFTKIGEVEQSVELILESSNNSTSSFQ